eukprot:SAG31_NODE_850_length_11521_cov_47.558396_7_plen_200_part_00
MVNHATATTMIDNRTRPLRNLLSSFCCSIGLVLSLVPIVTAMGKVAELIWLRGVRTLGDERDLCRRSEGRILGGACFEKLDVFSVGSVPTLLAGDGLAHGAGEGSSMTGESRGASNSEAPSARGQFSGSTSARLFFGPFVDTFCREPLGCVSTTGCTDRDGERCISNPRFPGSGPFARTPTPCGSAPVDGIEFRRPRSN